MDTSDAFWRVGLRPRKRRFFVGKVRGLFFHSPTPSARLARRSVGMVLCVRAHHDEAS